MSDRDAVSADVLREQLMAVPGVASADVEVGSGSAPAGVKVKLTPDADARRVGAEVQRLLAARGMRSRFSEERPPERAEDDDASEEGQDAAEATEEAPPQPAAEPPVPPSEPPPQPESGPPVMPESLEPEGVEMTEAPRPVSAGLRSVAVEERADGLGIVVTLDDGRSAARDFTSEDQDLDGAVIAALAEAAGVEVEAVATEWLEVDGGNVVTVVLRRDGALTAGAGVVRVGRAFAVGIAARAALDA